MNPPAESKQCEWWTLNSGYLLVFVHQFKELHPIETEQICSCGNASGSGRAIAQAVSHRLPTAAARVQTRVWLCWIL
jgi:hypothetical protein